jgi:hypothetical protein
VNEGSVRISGIDMAIQAKQSKMEQLLKDKGARG